MDKTNKEITFWDHLDDLRKVFFRIIIAVVIFMIAAFICKDLLFKIVLAPSKSDFALYRFFCWLSEILSMPALCPESFHVKFINTQLPAQFLIHMKMAAYFGILLVTPYIIYQLFLFILPALYENERKYSGRVIFFSLLLFYVGVLLNYFLIFPLSFRFLAEYQISNEVENMINISSYTDTLTMLSIVIGIVFEIPVIAWLLAKLGLLSDTHMTSYRRHAIVVILMIAAIITPTVDLFTLVLVFLPIYLLYELSIVIVKRTRRNEYSTP